MGTALVGRRTVIHELLDHTTCSAVENRKRQRFPQRTSPFAAARKALAVNSVPNGHTHWAACGPRWEMRLLGLGSGLQKSILKAIRGAIIRVWTASRTRTSLCCPVDTNSLI